MGRKRKRKNEVAAMEDGMEKRGVIDPDWTPDFNEEEIKQEKEEEKSAAELISPPEEKVEITPPAKDVVPGRVPVPGRRFE